MNEAEQLAGLNKLSRRWSGRSPRRQSVLCSFYSAITLLAMQTAVLARAILKSVRPSACPSVTFRCFVQMNEDTIVRFSASGRKIILHRVRKKGATLFFAITLPNPNRSSKFFYRHTQQKICNKEIVTYPTIIHLRRYATL